MCTFAPMLYLNDRLQDLDVETSLPLLSEQRREQAMCFKHEQGRRESCAAYLLLCEGLQKEYGILEPPLFTFSEHGKPEIIGHPEIFFNMSHCREAAICVLYDSPVGVDVERTGRFDEALVRHTMNSLEVEEIMKAERPDVEFIKFWTRKEALLKYTGEGIHNDMRNVLNHCKMPITTVVAQDYRYVYSVCGTPHHLTPITQ